MKEYRNNQDREIYDAVCWNGKNIEELKEIFGKNNVKLVSGKECKKISDSLPYISFGFSFAGSFDDRLFIKDTVLDDKWTLKYKDWFVVNKGNWIGRKKGNSGKYSLYSIQYFNNFYEETGSITDGYHTFDELYEYRKFYNALAFNFMAKDERYRVIKSKRHSDGEECFGGGWFIVMATLPGAGQISNHYKLEDWDLFNCNEADKAYEWDGHTPEEAARRIERFLESSNKTNIQFSVPEKVKKNVQPA